MAVVAYYSICTAAKQGLTRFCGNTWRWFAQVLGIGQEFDMQSYWN